jgi:4-amino-4-deoxychorismate lyase
MSRCIESIRLIDGRFENLHYHEQRMQRTLRSLYQKDETVGLERSLKETDYPVRGLYKCRVVYDGLSREVMYSPYTPKVIAQIKVVHDNNISYPFKFEDRSPINRLFDLRGECDDILIVRLGAVADCSFSNIVFRKGQQWFTPGSPLLEGTMRQRLIDQNKITAIEIQTDDIRSFDTFKLINAMLQFNGPEIEVSQIVF